MEERRNGSSERRGQDQDVARAVAEFQAGRDPERNFRRIFDRYYAPVRAFLSRRASPDDAVDLTQETFLRLYTGLKGFRGDAAFGTWVFRIAYNTWHKWSRGRSRRPESSYEDLGDDAFREGILEERGSLTLEDEEDPVEALLSEERREALREAVGDLPEKMRKCMELRLYQERPYREIAEILRISVETVKAHLFQGRKRLREHLADASEDRP